MRDLTKQSGLATQAVILIAYLAAGILSFTLAIPPGFLAPVWLPAAVALAATLLIGYRALPVIGLAMFLLALPYGFYVLDASIWRALPGSFGLALGAVLQAGLGRRMVLSRPGQGITLESGQELVRLILVGAILASLAGATFSVSWLVLGGFAPATLEFGPALVRNWAGNAVGAAAVTPIILLLLDRDRVSPLRKRNVALAFALLSTISLATFLITRMNALEDRRETFTSRVLEDHVALQERLNGARRRLESLQGFFAASQSVTQDEFAIFVDIAFGQFQSASTVHWLVVTPESQTPSHALLVPVDGLRPEPGRRLMVASDRDLVTDYYFEDLPSLLDAALISGGLSASPLNGDGASGWIAVAIPAFHGRDIPADLADRRRELRGLAVGTFQLSAILRSAFSHEGQIYHYRVSGIGLEGITHWQFGSVDTDPDLATTLDLPVGGQMWRIDYVATDAYLAAQQDWVSWAVIIVGLSFITLLNALALMSTARTDLIQRLVDEKTAETRTLSNNLSLILEHAADAIMSFDAKGRGVIVNPAAADLFGYEVEEMTGAVIHDLIHPVDIQGRPHSRAECPMIQAALEQSPHHGFDRFRRKDGSDFFAEFATETVRDEKGREIGAVSVVRDITERIEAEADRERFIERLTRANEELERFAFVASHDLQEPLRLISNFTGLLANRYSDALDETGRTYIRHTLDATIRMQALITDLLAYGRLNSDTSMTREAVDLGRLVEDTLNTLGPAVQTVREHIHIAPDLPVVQGNAARLGQLFQNLISNAVKFQPVGQTARVAITAEDEGDAWAITVSDNGIGIKRNYREQIFQPFKRLHSPDVYPGSGMGLAICRKIVESHRGVITVADNHPNGSRFRFTLPKGGAATPPDTGTETRDTAS